MGGRILADPTLNDLSSVARARCQTRGSCSSTPAATTLTKRDMPTLPGFKRFHDLRRALPSDALSQELVANLNRFHSRLKAATRFQGVLITPCSAGVQRGYTEGVRLLLMYSAAELLGETIQPKVPVDTWLLHDAGLAVRLRPIARASIRANKGMHKKLKEHVETLANGESIDVRPVASALRHMMAHGNFSPGGIGAVTKRDADALRDLSLCLRYEAVRQFNKWLVLWETMNQRPRD